MHAAAQLQEQRRRQAQAEYSLALLQHAHENPVQAIYDMLKDCERSAHEAAGSQTATALAHLASTVRPKFWPNDEHLRGMVQSALLHRHPDAADGQSYLMAMLDAVSFLYTRVIDGLNLDAHWIVSWPYHRLFRADKA